MTTNGELGLPEAPRIDLPLAPSETLGPAPEQPEGGELSVIPELRLTKDALWHALAEARRTMEEQKEYTDTVRAELEAWKYRATHDKLTQVLNLDGLERELERLDKSDAPVAVLFVDGDNIKAINENRSYAEGDKAIIGTARALERSVRDEDIVARIGGDEFVVLLSASPQAALKHDRRKTDGDLIKQIGLTKARVSIFVQQFNDEHPELAAEGFNISIGYAIRLPGMTPEEAKRQAAARMKEQKASTASSEYSSEQWEIAEEVGRQLDAAGIARRDAVKIWRIQD